MDLSADRLAEHLARGLAPLYVLHGNEPLSRIEAEDLIRQQARRDGETERSVHIVQGNFDWSAIKAGSGNASLFAQRKLLEIQLPTGKPGVEGAKVLEKLATHPPPDTVVLVSIGELDYKSQGSRWFQALSDAGVSLRLRAPGREQLPDWIARRLAKHGLTAERTGLDWLAERVEGNLLAAAQEVEKLALLAPPGPIDLATLKQAVNDVASFDVDEFTDSLLAGDASRYVRVLDGLREAGEELTLLNWQVSNVLRLLLRLKWRQSLPRSPRLDARQKALAERTAARLDTRQLKRALQLAEKIDRQIKGADSGDPWQSLSRLGLTLMAKTTKRDG